MGLFFSLLVYRSDERKIKTSKNEAYGMIKQSEGGTIMTGTPLNYNIEEFYEVPSVSGEPAVLTGAGQEGCEDYI